MISIAFFHSARLSKVGAREVAEPISKTMHWRDVELAQPLGAAGSEPPYRDSHLARFVGEVLHDARSGEDDDPDRKRFGHRVIALERRGVLVTART